MYYRRLKEYLNKLDNKLERFLVDKVTLDVIDSIIFLCASGLLLLIWFNW